jgi:hypothetical protein
MKPFKAVFTKNADGTYELAAVFSQTHDLFEEMVSQASGANDAAEQYASDMEDAEFETETVEYATLADIPNVLVKVEKKAAPLYKKYAGKK